MLSFLKVLKIFDESLARNVIGKTLETLKTLKIKSWIFGLSNIFLFHKKSYNLMAFIFFMYFIFVFYLVAKERHFSLVGNILEV
jgi:hypothetical protein